MKVLKERVSDMKCRNGLGRNGPGAEEGTVGLRASPVVWPRVWSRFCFEWDGGQGAVRRLRGGDKGGVKEIVTEVDLKLSGFRYRYHVVTPNPPTNHLAPRCPLYIS